MIHYVYVNIKYNEKKRTILTACSFIKAIDNTTNHFNLIDSTIHIYMV